MLLDGELRSAPMMVKATAFRLESNRHYSVAGYHSWPNVTLRMSDCDVNKVSTTFSANPLSTPTLVFSRGDSQGIAFPGVSCVRLYPDPSKTILFQNLVAGPQGTASIRVYLPYDPTIVGQELWVQAGWADSASPAFRMTNAYRVLWPFLPPIHSLSYESWWKRERPAMRMKMILNPSIRSRVFVTIAPMA